MAKLFYGSIDLKKIDKSKIITKDKNGQPFNNNAAYFPINIWVNDEEDQYGNKVAVQVQTTKEEREQGIKGVYLGNLKEHVRQEVPTGQPDIMTAEPALRDEDDLPF